jgi:hypothetical protein
MMGELLIDALRWIRQLPRFADRAKMAVVMDQAPCHVKIDVAREAAQLDMDLIPFPPGNTGTCQPMDVRIFGVLKRKQGKQGGQGKQGKQGKLYGDAMCACPGRSWTKADAPRTIIEACRVDANVVKAAWRRTCSEAEGIRPGPAGPTMTREGLALEALPPLP